MQLIDKRIEDYCISKSNTPGTDCESIENYTRQNVSGAQMLIGKLEGSILGFLIRANGAKRVLEIGTFTGYSALVMAENLPQDGELITVDINVETVQLAKKFWGQSAHGSKIKSLLGNGLESIKVLEGQFDFVFIDADKKGYLEYLKIALEKLSPRGMIVVDNVLWSGRVVETLKGETEEHRNTKAIQEFNDFVAGNEKIYGTLLPVRDGMFLIKKI